MRVVVAKMKLEITDQPSEADSSAIANGLSQHATKASHPWDEQELAVFYRNEKGEIIAGLTGVTFWKCLSIKHLWVSEELRGKGIGRALMEAAEKEAMNRGCTLSSLDTYTFQSPEFYDRLGYKLCGQMNDFPEGETRLFYSKKI